MRLRLSSSEARDRAAAAAEEHRALVEHRARHAVAVTQPLLLISQLQRSGGTLLSQLLDGHPEVHAHPHELHTGYPKQHIWPELPLDAGPDRWYEILREAPAEKHFREGYRKYSKAEEGAELKRALPFLQPPLLKRALFERCVSERRPDGSRGIFDCYLTAYFNAWLDNRNLHTGPKRWISAFAPRIFLETTSVSGFFDTYSDGALVSVVRDPRSWYASARRHAELGRSKSRRREYGSVESGVDLWRRAAEAVVAAKAAHPDRVYLMEFEALLEDTTQTMRSLSSFTGISWSPSLLEPTFNGMKIVSNTGFEIAGTGVRSEPLRRYRDALAPEEAEFIERHTRELYEKLLSLAAGTSPSGGRVPA